MPITRVAAQDAQANSATTSVTASYPTIPAAGSLLVAAVGVGGTTTHPTVADSGGAWQEIVWNQEGTATRSIAIFAKIATVAQPTGVTATRASATAMWIDIYEFTGASSTFSGATNTSESTATVSNTTGGGLTAFNAGSLFFAAMRASGALTSPFESSAEYTVLQGNPTGSSSIMLDAYAVVDEEDDGTPVFSWSNSRSYCLVTAEFLVRVATFVDIETATGSSVPSSAVLDNFNRADEGPPPTGWEAATSSTLGQVVSGKLAFPDYVGDLLWEDSLVGADVEAFVTLSTLPTLANSTVEVNARAHWDGSAFTGYGVRWKQAATDTISIYVYAPSFSLIAGPFNQNLSAGDILGIRCVGSTIQAWAKVSGTWTLVGSVTHTSFSGAAPNDQTGLRVVEENDEVNPSAVRLDDFSGGTIKTEHAQPLSYHLVPALTRAVETDTARQLFIAGHVARTAAAGLVFLFGDEEGNTLSITRATETDAAQAIHARRISPALETDTAVQLGTTAVQHITIGVPVPSLQFGELAVIDDFNRPDASPPVSGWGNFGIRPGAAIVSNQLIGSTGATLNNTYYTTSMTGPDVEAYVTNVNADLAYVAARLDPIASKGYLVATISGELYIIVRTGDPGGFTLGHWPLGGVAANDRLGIRCVGNEIQAWYSGSGGTDPWSMIGSVIDSTYSGAPPYNKLGLILWNNLNPLDDFGGGVFSLVSDRAVALSYHSVSTPLTPATETGVAVALDYFLDVGEFIATTTETDQAMALSYSVGPVTVLVLDPQHSVGLGLVARHADDMILVPIQGD